MLSGFLQADPAAIDAQRRRMGAMAGGRPRIGLSWRSANADFGPQKSLRLDDFTPLFAAVDAFWVDLQYGDTTAERTALQAGQDIALWRDPAIDPLRDMDAAAAQYAALDLVITTSNTAAHLAGALGLPVWLLLPAPGYGLLWYWFLDRPDSPFYSSLQCFRQERPGDWTGPVGLVAMALKARFGPKP
ncbi:hypothetical protein [Ferrovibrio sp.]|uniref:hypothetical protein n=1 Tax=Ferrovibrio sp. TaxID=1917215 RepID=UPI00262054B3|nr:hypothetical protein [Ferrovibrio sp.]